MNISMGLSQGIMPLVSYTYASGNHKRMKGTVFFSVKVVLSFLTLVAVGYYIGAGSLISLFMKNDAIIAYGTRFLRGFCIGLPFLAMDFLVVSVYQSLRLGINALIFAIMRKIVLEIPLLFALNRFFPLYGLAYAQPVTEILLAIAAVITLLRIFRRLEHPKKSPEYPSSDQND